MNNEQQNDFNNIIQFIGDFFPKDTLYSDLGTNNPKDVNTILIPDIELEEMAMKKIKQEHEFMTNQEFINYFKSTEPFNIYSKNWEIFISDLEKCYE